MTTRYKIRIKINTSTIYEQYYSDINKVKTHINELFKNKKSNQ